ncbi:MAG: hypothetical protein AAFW47_07895 [Pseudomonadota bacterium]
MNDGEKLDAILERLDILQYDLAKLETRLDAVENELRLTVHEHTPLLTEMREELVQMKRVVDDFADLSEAERPIEARQAPPRR